MIRNLAGRIAVTILKLLARLPLWIPLAVGTTLLPLYIPFRRRTRTILSSIHAIEGRIAMCPYYRMRLRLALLSLRHLLRLPDGCTVTIEGEEHYRAALASGRPVLILGWHQGPVELLHRIPHESPLATGRPAFLLTAKAFAPALTELMKSGRGASRSSATSKEILHPHSLAGLRRWEKEKGILAMMIDQVPGEPEEWLAPLRGSVQLPYPGRLLDWLSEKDAEVLVVTVRLETNNRIHFRYALSEAKILREDLPFHLDRSLRAGSEQYNWSYPKIRFQRDGTT